MTKFTHGGLRPGAGRKPISDSGDRAISITVTVTPRQAAWLRTHSNVSAVVRALVAEAMAHRPPEMAAERMREMNTSSLTKEDLLALRNDTHVAREIHPRFSTKNEFGRQTTARSMSLARDPSCLASLVLPDDGTRPFIRICAAHGQFYEHRCYIQQGEAMPTSETFVAQNADGIFLSNVWNGRPALPFPY